MGEWITTAIEGISLSLFLGAIWVMIGTFVAFLPMRYQYPPGIMLLIAAPFLLGFVAYQHGAWIFFVGLFAFASMFRNPLIYFYRKWRGLPWDGPE
ncbi:DUF2484 family protein [Parasulfitobacter algicola]|uniref:DUF2484 family protein n=1 Tax=Parasulfitobacter algicola TaxID=2614809 RepID=UPI001C2D5E07|nr:DUF2484 family protein [Sulfitobacter algicola]